MEITGLQMDKLENIDIFQSKNKILVFFEPDKKHLLLLLFFSRRVTINDSEYLNKQPPS